MVLKVRHRKGSEDNAGENMISGHEGMVEFILYQAAKQRARDREEL